jgi:hypothetical protein
LTSARTCDAYGRETPKRRATEPGNSPAANAATTAAFVFESIFFGIRAPFRVGGDYTIFIFTSGGLTAIFSRFFENRARFDKNFAAKRFSDV